LLGHPGVLVSSIQGHRTLAADLVSVEADVVVAHAADWARRVSPRR